MRQVTLGFIVLLAVAVSAPAPAATSEDAVQQAIVDAVRARIGARADVRIEDLRTHGGLLTPLPPLVAVPTPGARLGTRIRFLLRASGVRSARVGEAEATVFASAPHLRADRALHRGVAIEDNGVVDVVGEVGDVLLDPLPTRETIAGAIAARDIASGEILTAAVLIQAPLVKPGDKILVRLSESGLAVQASLVAAQTGRLGDVIRCVNPDTRRAIAARIVGRGIAEVVHAF